MNFFSKRKGLIFCFLLAWAGTLTADPTPPLVGSFYMSEEALNVLAPPEDLKNPYQLGRSNILDEMVDRSSILSIDEAVNRNRTKVIHGIPWDVFVDRCGSNQDEECTYQQIRDFIINGNSSYDGELCDSSSLTKAQGWLCTIDRTKASITAIPNISTKYIVLHDHLMYGNGGGAARAELVDPVENTVDINYTLWLPNDVSDSVVPEGGSFNPYSSLFDSPVGIEIIPVVNSDGDPVSPTQLRIVSDVFGAGGYRSSKVREAVSRYAAFLMEHYQSDAPGKEFHVNLYIPYREYDFYLLSFLNMNSPASDPYKQMDGLLSLYSDIVGKVKVKSPETIVAPSWQAQDLAIQKDAKNSSCDNNYVVGGNRNPISCYDALRQEIKKYYLVNKKVGMDSVLAWSFYLSFWVPGGTSKTFTEFASDPLSLTNFTDDSNNYFVSILNDLSSGETITTCIPEYLIESCMGGNAPQTTVQSVAIPYDATGEASAVPIFFSETSWPIWNSDYDFLSLEADQKESPLMSSIEGVQLAYYYYLLDILPSKIDYSLLGVTNTWEISLSVGANSIFGAAPQYQANGLFRPTLLSKRATDAALYFYSFSNNDLDNDGVPNITITGSSVTDIEVSSRDNCPLVDNGVQEDSDGDGVGDACDGYPYIADSLQLDLNLNDKVDTPLVLKSTLLNLL